MRWVQWLAYVVALLLRLWTAAHYSAPLQERVELSSPLTSFKRRTRPYQRHTLTHTASPGGPLP